MTTAIINIAIGVVLLAGGASGRLGLIGTGSPTALMVGGAVIAFGIFQAVRAAREKR
jgi:hypothetical protein